MKSFKTLLFASALGLFVAVPLARAAEQEVDLKNTPDAVQKTVHREEGKGAKNTQVYQVVKEDKDYFMVHYVADDGKHMRLRVAPNGKVLAKGETRKQAKKERLAAAKTAEERAQIEQQLQQEREAEDRRAFESWQAAQARQASAATPGPLPTASRWRRTRGTRPAAVSCTRTCTEAVRSCSATRTTRTCFGGARNDGRWSVRPDRVVSGATARPGADA